MDGEGRLDINTVVSAKGFKATLITSSNGIKLPFTVFPIDLAYNEGCFNGELFFEIKLNDSFAYGIKLVLNLCDTYICVRNLAKVLPTVYCIVNSYGNSNLVHFGRDFREVDKDLLIITSVLFPPD